MSHTSPKVDAFLERSSAWREEFEQLRTILLGCGLTETLKWGNPCYTSNDRNIVLMHGFKEYCALLFFKGALLKDEQGILVQQTENVQAARQLRFTGSKDITRLKTAIRAYVKEAIEVEQAGLSVSFKKTEEFSMPEEFRQLLSDDTAVKKAFEALTPGRQRAYLLHFSSARQAKTREARIVKCLPQILEGKGLND